MKHFLYLVSILIGFLSCANARSQQSAVSQDDGTPVVYFTKDISPEGLVRIFDALGVKPEGRVAVKISTGESENSNHLRPELIGDLVRKVNGTLVECNTAYDGSRSNTTSHRAEIAKRGYENIAHVDIMDEEGEIKVPVKDDKWIKYDIVGSHIQNYDFMINLAHFKGHAMGGFGGVLKNASIGVGSQNGKAYIHSAGKTEDWHQMWQNLPEGWKESPENNTPFIESMAAAAQAVHDYFKGRGGIVYIDVMNNISIDCDCDGNPHKPTIQDIGIAASLDPVALDKFCLDQVMNIPSDENNDTKALLERISQRHGTRIVYRAEENGLGSTQYQVVNIDNMNNGKTLVAWFSWSHNTEVMAKYIAEKTGAELFQIERVNPYPEEYKPCTVEAKKEVDGKIYPAIKALPENFDKYETIIVGAPVWWYTAPMPVFTFLEKSGLDFSGKTVIPFCTAYTAEYNTLEDIVKVTPTANHKEGICIVTKEMDGKNLDGKKPQVDAWLKAIGL